MKNNIYKNRQNFNSNGNNKRIKNEKLRNILSWLLIGILCFTIIGSVLGTIAFGKTHTASADNVSIFSRYKADNFFVPVTCNEIKASGSVGDYIYSPFYTLSFDVAIEREHLSADSDFPCLRLKASITNRDAYLGVKAPGGNENFQSQEIYPDLINFTLPNSVNICQLPSGDTTYNSIWSEVNTTGNPSRRWVFYLLFEDRATSGYNVTYGRCQYIANNDFNCDVQSVRMVGRLYERTAFKRVVNSLIYTDTEGNKACLEFVGSFSKSVVYTGQVAWEDRTYYLPSAFDDDVLYDNGYNDGFAKGEHMGVLKYKDSSDYQKDAHDKFYNKFIEEYKESSSFKTLIEQAKESGRMEERAEGNDVTFTNTLSAMYNAPLGAFKQFLSFELLGVDMFGFFTGLFTIAFVLFVIKKLT